MKKFIIFCLVVVLLGCGWILLTQYGSVFFRAPLQEEVQTFTTVEGKTILVDQGDGLQPFEIRGVDMGVGIPGHFATDYAIDKETYLRWFAMIQDMGANCVRVYTILQQDFYDAVWEYNQNNDNPLYFIHGLWLNDYVHFSHRDAYDPEFLDAMIEDGYKLINILHGNQKFSLGTDLGSGSYTKDVSPWMLGYILGVEWEDTTVAFTNHMLPERNTYQGKYMYTTPEATPFEAMLAQLGDKLIAYETMRYRSQRLMAFTNWPTTDPFDWDESVRYYFRKFEKVDVEHIKTTEAYLSGQFASYHIYPYFPDYLGYQNVLGFQVKNREKFTDANGVFNSYRAYLTMVNEYHTMPVIISEYGVPSSRGRAQADRNTNRAQGGMSEKEQAQALITCYEDIMAAGCAGSVAFTWQDEWFKRTWNTMAYTDLTKTPYWSDYQTNEQYFGILSFDPGEDQSVCYVDGDVSEWTQEDLVFTKDDMSLSCKYDEKYMYFYLNKRDYDPDNEVLYLPLDITPKTGSTSWAGAPVSFDTPADFLLILSGRDDSKLLVQERYEALRAMFSHRVYAKDAYLNEPPKDTDVFVPIHLMLQVSDDPSLELNNTGYDIGSTFETGALIHGNGNPENPDFNSLADFIIVGDNIEIRLPWGLLNFMNPAEMMIHDDYYEHYGVEPLGIHEFRVGVGTLDAPTKRIAMHTVPLRGWGRYPTYHERLKEGYYALKEIWRPSA